MSSTSESFTASAAEAHADAAVGEDAVSKLEDAADADLAACAAGLSIGESAAAAVAEQTVQALCSGFGFEEELAKKAVAAIGDPSDVGLAVSWLLDQGEDRGGAVRFQRCPHLDAGLPLVAQSALAFGLPCCEGCPGAENWLCLQCGETRCSRYGKGHSIAHYTATRDAAAAAADGASGKRAVGSGPHEHPTSLSLSDLSTWCYACECYVEHERLTPLLKRMRELKFGEEGGSGKVQGRFRELKFGEEGGGGGGGSSASACLPRVPEDGGEDDAEDEPRRPLDLDAVAELIRDAPDRSVLVMVGAGASVSAGIPDFRSPGTGLYDNLQEYGLPHPEAIFDIDYFQSNPAPFYRLAREIWPSNFAPTAAHRFFRALHEKGKLLRVFTQNIDSLERLAGLPAEQIVAAHGNFDAAHMVGTGAPADIEELRAALREENPDGTPAEAGWRRLRDEYGGLVKPTITFFGEALPERFGERALEDFPEARLLLIFGTSLKVQPFASLVAHVEPGTPRLLVNRERCGEDLGLDFETEGSSDGHYRGDCDDAVHRLASLLGWDLGAAEAPAAAGS